MRKRFNYKKNNRGIIKKVFVFTALGSFTIFVFTLGSFLINLRKVIKAQNKFIIAVRQNNNDVHIHIIDPSSRKYVIINIPSETLVDASNNLGQWRIGTLWKLGQNEKMGGEVLGKSIIRNFNFPISYWADYQAENFSEGNILKILKSTFNNYKSNLHFYDKIALLFYGITIPKDSREFIDLAKSKFLKEGRLPDGENGYLVTENFPDFLLPIFSNLKISNYKIMINNQGAYESDLKKVSGIIEVLGGKVAYISKSKSGNFVCSVWGKDQNIENLVSKLFSCNVLENPTNQGFDLEISLGKDFSNKN